MSLLLLILHIIILRTSDYYFLFKFRICHLSPTPCCDVDLYRHFQHDSRGIIFLSFHLNGCRSDKLHNSNLPVNSLPVGGGGGGGGGGGRLALLTAQLNSSACKCRWEWLLLDSPGLVIYLSTRTVVTITHNRFRNLINHLQWYR